MVDIGLGGVEGRRMVDGRARYRLNVVGPFYVEDGCCTACGVPDAEAPELFATDEGEVHCFVKKQPESPRELFRMLSTIARAELPCIRYAGEDPEVLQRLADLGAAELCDVPVKQTVPVVRDHVTFVLDVYDDARALLGKCAEEYAAMGRRVAVTGGADDARLEVVWSPGDVFTLECVRLAQPDAGWLLRGCTVTNLHAWLDALAGCSAIRWYTRAQWESGGPWRETPW